MAPQLAAELFQHVATVELVSFSALQEQPTACLLQTVLLAMVLLAPMLQLLQVLLQVLMKTTTRLL